MLATITGLALITIAASVVYLKDKASKLFINSLLFSIIIVYLACIFTITT
jgi:hypothetical protein